MHGACLVQALQEQAPGLRCLGMGGAQMRRQNFQALFRAEELSIVGLTEAVSKLPKVLLLYKRIKKSLQTDPPLAIVLIDAPDFHFHLAKIAFKMGIPVYYYISPQVWAWRKNRVKFLQRYISKILCILPFEKQFFTDYGIDVEFVGHPILQQMEKMDLEQIEPQAGTIGILPGSRNKEVSSLLPRFASAARIIHSQRPQARFKLIQAPAVPSEMLHRHWPADLPCDLVPFSNRYAQIKSCALVITASGTASLECALLQVPAIVAYRLSWTSYLVGRMFIKVPYISIPNLILQSQVYPEFIQSGVSGPKLATQALDWLQHPHKAGKIRTRLADLQYLLGQSKASQTSASIILNELQAANHLSITQEVG